jgi:hypothetical protein
MQMNRKEVELYLVNHKRSDLNKTIGVETVGVVTVITVAVTMSCVYILLDRC